MLHHFNRMRRSFARILMIMLSISVSRLAIGQTQPSTCTNDVSSELADIVGALHICDEVSRLSKTQVSVQAFTEEDRIRAQQLEQERAEAWRKVELHLEASAIHLSNANVVLSKLIGRQVNTLKYSALVIGMLGAGVGGGLHLVNNPHVGHAATVLGLSAGVVGGGMNLVVLKWGPKASTLPQEVQDFISISEHKPNIASETLHRSQLAKSLEAMGSKLDLLNKEMLTLK
jgi:hypothetical protein